MNVFEAWEGSHEGETAVLIGTGPTIKEFSPEVFPGAVLAGSNEAIYLPFDLDFYFIGDAGTKRRGYLSDPEAYNKYRPTIAPKFIRIKTSGHYNAVPRGLPECYYYKIHQASHSNNRIPVLSADLNKGPNDAGSISFEVLQFLLWCGFKKIILAGHDSDYSKGSFKTKVGQDIINWSQVIRRSWRRTAVYLQENCPDVEVYSFKPVALDMFPEIEGAPPQRNHPDV